MDELLRDHEGVHDCRGSGDPANVQHISTKNVPHHDFPVAFSCGRHTRGNLRQARPDRDDRHPDDRFADTECGSNHDRRIDDSVTCQEYPDESDREPQHSRLERLPGDRLLDVRQLFEVRVLARARTGHISIDSVGNEQDQQDAAFDSADCPIPRHPVEGQIDDNQEDSCGLEQMLVDQNR